MSSHVVPIPMRLWQVFGTGSSLCKHGYQPHLNDFYNLCELIIHTKDSLNDHVKFHSGIKDFRCGDCGKQFVQQRSLMQHVDVHHLQHLFESLQV